MSVDIHLAHPGHAQNESIRLYQQNDAKISSGVPMIERTRKYIDFLHISSTFQAHFFFINLNMERAGKSRYFYFRFH